MKNLQSFTLIELILTISIMAIILTVLTGVLTSVVRAQIKTTALLEVKRNGDSTISKVQEAVRTSKQVDVVGDTITFTTQNDKDFTMGFVAGVGTGCNGTSTNGYLYLKEGNTGTIAEEDKITNDDLKDGVNVVTFIPSIDTTGLTPTLELTLKIDKGLCSRYSDNDIVRNFKTTVSSRAFFNGP